MRPPRVGWWRCRSPKVFPEGLLELDVDAEIGEAVVGPDGVFATMLAEIMLSGKDLRRARALAAEVLRDGPQVVPIGAADRVPG